MKTIKREKMMAMDWARMRTMKRIGNAKWMRVVILNSEHSSLNVVF